MVIFLFIVAWIVIGFATTQYVYRSKRWKDKYFGYGDPSDLNLAVTALVWPITIVYFFGVFIGTCLKALGAAIAHPRSED